MELEYLCTKAIAIVKEVGIYILSERANFSSQKDVELKGHSNFVTYVDKSSEKQLVSNLGKLLPGSGFIAEEGTSNAKGETYNWVIDPLDGTTNFIHGLTPYSISVALMQGNEVIMGIVYEISHGDMFHAIKGGGAFLNGLPIKVSDHSEHQHALIVTGFPYYDFSKMERYVSCLKEFMEKTSGIRRLGSASIDLCYVACGKFEAFWEYSLNSWDVAAGAFIVQQAGGKVSDFNGGNNYIFGSEIIATNDVYFNNFYEIVNKHLGK